MPQTVEDLIDELEEWLEEAEEIIDDAPSDPLPSNLRDQVAGKLTETESSIDQILDPDVAPNLDPPDAGSVDQSINPVGLKDYAATAHDLALNARVAAGQSSPDEQYIGTQLKTIKHLLPGYRAAAGIV